MRIKLWKAVTFAATLVLGNATVALAGPDGDKGTPLPTGLFSSSITGSLAVCVDPTTFANEPCSTQGAVAIAFSLIGTGYTTRDAAGGCHTRTEMFSPLTPNGMPATVDGAAHIPFKITGYDPATGVGDLSFTLYEGGKCLGGSKFDSKGATMTGTGTEHFAVSQGGARIDGIITTLVGAPNSFSYGSIALNQVDLKQ